jgi:hypothetical protein
VLLAACSPLKIGAAAVVGNQRITSATLDSDVSSLQQADNQYGGNQIPADQQPQAVLSWLIRFAIRDKVASDNGISVNKNQINSALADVNSELEENAEQNGSSFNGLAGALADLGLPPTQNLITALGQWEAQELAYIEKQNGGKLPTSQTAADNAEAELNKADCRAANSLNIQVSPQYGRLDYSSYTIVEAPNLLSAPSVVASPAPTTGLVPAC